MVDPSGFWAQVRQRIQPETVSWVVDLWRYVLLWTGLLIFHVIRLLMALVVEQWFVNAIGWMEKATVLASFCSFFGRIWVRLYRDRKVSD